MLYMRWCKISPVHNRNPKAHSDELCFVWLLALGWEKLKLQTDSILSSLLAAIIHHTRVY